MYKVKKQEYHSPSVKKPNLVFLGREINTYTVKCNEGHRPIGSNTAAQRRD